MKILNLFAGIGGNTKKWDRDKNDIVSVEYDEDKAEIYRDIFPQDKVIVADARKYLLEHYKEFDFIWASPPCPTHSQMKETQIKSGQVDPVYADMDLYKIIIFLDKFFDGNWVVENVKPYYEPLIKPQKVGRHRVWANFSIENRSYPSWDLENSSVKELQEKTGFDLSGYDLSHDKKRKILRNVVNPDLGLQLLKSRSKKQSTLLGVASNPPMKGETH